MSNLTKTRRLLLTCFLLMSATLSTHAQQGLNYTQYMDNQISINPTFSLLNSYGTFNTLVRKQWINVPGAPTTYLLNGSVPIESLQASTGLSVENDVFAIEHLTEVNAFFAKSIRLNDKGFLAVSLSAGFRNYIANYSGIDASDPVFRNDVRETRPNFGFGAMYYTSHYYVGLSVPELSIRNLGDASVQDAASFKNHYYLTLGTGSQINEDYKFKYAAIVSYTRDVPVLANIATMVTMKNVLGIGVNYQTNNEVAGMLSVNYNVLHLGYAYQFGTTNSNIGSFSNATHEVTLGFRFGKKSDFSHPE